MNSQRANIARQFLFLWNLIVPALAIYFCWQGNGLLALLILLSAHLPWLLSTFIPNLGCFGPVFTHFVPNPKSKEVWLTIDDGPDPTDTPYLLDLLDQYQAKATFFFIGEKVQKYPDLALQVLQRGHQIGNHTQTHPEKSFWAATPARAKREIDQCQQVLQTLTQSAPSVFRAPVGFKNPWVQEHLARKSLPLLAWTHRGFDGSLKDPARILKHLTKDIRSGCILLVHESKLDLQDQPLCPQVLQPLLEHLKNQGFHCIIPEPQQWR